MKPFLFAILFSAFLYSCKDESGSVSMLLQRAEHFMELRPDSALKILQEISEPEKLQDQNQADYALLMVQALDKNYMPLESDSLIQLAIRYFKHSNNYVSKGKAYFYYGRYLYEAKEYEEALNVFLNSRRILEGSKQYKLLGLLAEYIGGINFRKGWYDDALLNHKQSIEYYGLVQDTLSITFALRNIGRAYLFKEKSDSAFLYCSKAFEIATKKRLKSESAILHELGIIGLLTGEYDKAESYILSSIYEVNSNEKCKRYLALGYLYTDIELYEKAEDYLKLCLNASLTDMDIYSSVYEAYSSLEQKKENYKAAFDFKEKRDSLNKIINAKEKRKIIADLQEKYQNEKLKNENLQIRSATTSAVLLGVIVILVALFVAVYYYNRFVSNRRKIEEIEQSIARNEDEIIEYKRELLEHTNQKEENQNVIGELKGKIALLTNQNRNLTERIVVLGYEKPISNTPEQDLFLMAFRTLISMKAGTLNRKLSDYDHTLLLKLFDFIYNDYVIRLKNKFKDLTKHEIELCCLLRLGFTNRELCDVYNTAPESVSKSKSRLKLRLKIPNSQSLESFLATYC